MIAQTEVFSKYISENKLSGGFLLIGSDEEQLKEEALMFASLINCSAHASTPCGECSWCESVERGYHPDLMLVEREEGVATIKIAEVRTLMKRVMMSAYQCDYKVSVVLSADTMTEEAANSFLKVLEEPPLNTIFIFTTVFPDKILSTIRSRCKEIIMSHAGTFDDLLQCDDDMLSVLRGEAEADTNISRDALYELLCAALGYYRDIMLYKSLGDCDEQTREEIFLNTDYMDYVREDSSGMSMEEVISKLESLERLVSMIKKTYLNTKLVLQNLFIENVIPLKNRIKN